MRELLVASALLALQPSVTVAAGPAESNMPGSRAPEQTGGPDLFGYTYADQAEGSCPFHFVDISTTGTFVIADDDAAAVVALGGSGIDVYGATFTSLTLATNGYVSTDPADAGPDLTNDCPLPAPPSTGGGARLYPLHDDLVTEIRHQYFATCPRPHDEPGFPPMGCDVFLWVGTYVNGGEPVYFQAVLYEEVYEVVFQVLAAGQGGSLSTTGIQDFAPVPTTGLTYACNSAASISAGTAVCFFHPAPVPVELLGFTVE